MGYVQTSGGSVRVKSRARVVSAAGAVCCCNSGSSGVACPRCSDTTPASVLVAISGANYLTTTCNTFTCGSGGPLAIQADVSPLSGAWTLLQDPTNSCQYYKLFPSLSGPTFSYRITCPTLPTISQLVTEYVNAIIAVRVASSTSSYPWGIRIIFNAVSTFDFDGHSDGPFGDVPAAWTSVTPTPTCKTPAPFILPVSAGYCFTGSSFSLTPL